MHNVNDLILIFERCFFAEFHTLLQGGVDEPFYLPPAPPEPAKILFTRDYFASALHEVAHWCVAGEDRRRVADYGYWYAPDGRSAAQQAEFERVEIKPQALEWLFSSACGTPFRVSADNLTSGLGASVEFRDAIAAQARRYCQQLPVRPARFIAALSDFYRTSEVLSPANYQAGSLV